MCEMLSLKKLQWQKGWCYACRLLQSNRPARVFIEGRGENASKIQHSRFLGVLKGAVWHFLFQCRAEKSIAYNLLLLLDAKLWVSLSAFQQSEQFLSLDFIPTRQNGFQDRGPAPHPLDRGHHQVLEMRSTLVKPSSTGWSLPRCWQGHQPRQQEQIEPPSRRSRSVRPSRQSPGITYWSEDVFLQKQVFRTSKFPC